jgi:hypothetical protein
MEQVQYNESQKFNQLLSDDVVMEWLGHLQDDCADLETDDHSSLAYRRIA